MISTITILLLLAIIAVLVFCLFSCRKKNVFLFENEKNRQSALVETAAVLGQLIESIGNDKNVDSWQEDICSLLREKFSADSVIIMTAVSSDKNEKEYRLAASSGNISWYNPHGDADFSFSSDISKFFFWSHQSHIISENDLAACIPHEKAALFSSALAGMFHIDNHASFLAILRENSQSKFENHEKADFDSCFHLIKAGYELLNFKNQSVQLERAVHNAHEEGMLQISTGIIHNIGNGIAVIKIALDRLKEFGSISELSRFLKDEVMPELRGQLQNDTVKDQEKISQYINAIDEIMERITNISNEYNHELAFISGKFQNVIEVITLQQQFIGELGTENVVPFRMIISDVIKMCESPIQESDITLKESLECEKCVLVDPALLKQVFLTIMKYAVHSINKIHRTPSTIEILCRETVSSTGEDKRKFVTIDIKDNGYGIEFNPDAKFKEHSRAAQEHRELLFCKNKIEKYGGSFSIQSKFGSGTSVHINIPVYESDDNAKKT